MAEHDAMWNKIFIFFVIYKKVNSKIILFLNVSWIIFNNLLGDAPSLNIRKIFKMNKGEIQWIKGIYNYLCVSLSGI